MLPETPAWLRPVGVRSSALVSLGLVKSPGYPWVSPGFLWPGMASGSPTRLKTLSDARIDRGGRPPGGEPNQRIPPADFEGKTMISWRSGPSCHTGPHTNANSWERPAPPSSATRSAFVPKFTAVPSPEVPCLAPRSVPSPEVRA